MKKILFSYNTISKKCISITIVLVSKCFSKKQARKKTLYIIPSNKEANGHLSIVIRLKYFKFLLVATSIHYRANNYRRLCVKQIRIITFFVMKSIFNSQKEQKKKTSNEYKRKIKLQFTGVLLMLFSKKSN